MLSPAISDVTFSAFISGTFFDLPFRFLISNIAKEEKP